LQLRATKQEVNQVRDSLKLFVKKEDWAAKNLRSEERGQEYLKIIESFESKLSTEVERLAFMIQTVSQ
jgi:hypothetical protein